MPPEISKRETIQMMNRCKQEILSLRSVISRLEPKAEAYDNLVRVLCLLPQPGLSRSVGEDLVWILDKRIRELAPEPEAKTSDDEALLHMKGLADQEATTATSKANRMK